MPRPALTSWLPTRRRPHTRLALGFEQLEDRTMPTATPGLVVGRTLSAYTTGGVSNNQVTITYTAYNDQAPPILGVLLSDTLAPGVTVVSASHPHTQNGQELAWSLGTIETGYRASVSVTVTVPVSILSAAEPQLDSGPRASGTLYGSPVSDAAPAARLIQGTVAPTLLASTPDANTTDPFVQHQAAALDYDPQRIFDYMRDDIGYESYAGSVRGARGAMWSAAGNALDVASLGVALMRASGVPAQYAQGTLGQPAARQLVLSMFPEQFQTVGYVPAGTPIADPANDPTLLGEAANHFWFRYDTGTGMRDADPLTRPAAGQSAATATGTFAEVPDALREKTRVTLTAEVYDEASARINLTNSLSSTVVLDQTFNDVDLVGRPLTLGHFVSSSSTGFLFTATTFTYTPYLLVGDAANATIEQAGLVSGTPFQEVFTSFPLGNRVLTGLSLRVTLSGPQRAPETFERYLVDRIGFDDRRSGRGGGALVFDPSAPPIINPLDVRTLSVQASAAGSSFPGTVPTMTAALAARLAALAPELQNPATAERAITDVARQLAGMTQAFAPALLTLSDATTGRLAAQSLVAAYFDRPRVVLIENTVEADAQAGTARTVFSIDLTRDTVRAIAAPGQRADAARVFQAVRGVAENFVEATAPERAFGNPPPGTPPGISAATLFPLAAAQGIPLVLLGPGDQGRVGTLDISDEARARISLALELGYSVVVPAWSVQVAGAAEIAWYQVDPGTGESIGVGENGRHVNVEKSTLWAAVRGPLLIGGGGVAVFEILTNVIPLLQNFFSTAILRSLPAFARQIQADLASASVGETSGLSELGPVFAGLLGQAAGVPLSVHPSAVSLLNPDPPPPFGRNQPSLDRPVAATLAGPASTLTLAPSQAALTADQNTPAAFDLAVNTSVAGDYHVAVEAPRGWTATLDAAGRVTVTPAPGVQGGTYPISMHAFLREDRELAAATVVMVTVTPTSPGITFGVAPDSEVGVPFAGASLPTGFRATIHNRGPAADTFDLSLSAAPAGFALVAGSPRVTIPAGETGFVGVYLVPTGAQIPPPGTAVTFTVTATSTTNPAITQTRTVNFTVPEIHGVTLSADRPTLGTTPGTGVNVALTLTSVGNVAETVALTATLPAGLTIGGLTGTVPLALRGTQTLNLTLTPGAAVPLNSTLAVTITATFASGELGVQTIQLPIRVVAPGADAAANAVGSASQAGNPDLANRLSDLATGITNLFQATDSAVFKSQVLAALDAVAGLVAGDYFLAPLVPPPTAARAALVAAVTQAEVRAALTQVGDYLAVLAPQLAAVARHGFTFELDRNAAVIQPNVPTRFQVFLQNLGTQPTTYQLVASSVVGVRYVRNGATITSITLQPGQVIAGGPDGVSLEVTSNTSSTLPFAFTATARAAPATQLSRTVAGSVTFRPAFIRVASVVTTPPFTAAAGPTVDVTARLYNAMNTAQDVFGSYVVRDPGGAVVFTSPTVAFTLPAQGATLTPLTLAPFPTAGVANGEYVVDVTITDAAGAALPGGTGSGRVRVGLPVSAALVSTVEILSPGNQATRSSTQSLTLSGVVPLVNPFTLIGQATTSGNSNSLAIIGNIAYVAGSEAVDIVDISNPANPVLVGSFAQGFVPPNGYSLVRDLPGDRIAVLSSISLNATGFDLRVYDVSNPLVPTLVSDTTIDQRFPADFQAVGNTALVSTTAESFLGNVYVGPLGDLVSIDLAAAGGPTITDRLFNTGTPSTGGPHQFGIELVDSDTAYVASFTTSPALAGRRVGRLLVVDYTDPANLVLTRELQLPTTFKLYDVAISGNTALVVGTDNNDAGGVTTRFNTGHLTLITLDITDRDNPVVVSTEVTTATFPTNEGGRLGYPSVVPVGGGKFAVSNAVVGGDAAILLVDASDPSDIRTAALHVGSNPVDEITVAGGNLYATSDDGLLVFDVGDVESIAATASVQVPTGRARNFNIAPDRITTAAGIDTLEWDRVLGAGLATQELTWIQNLPVSPGLFADITFGGTVAFTSQGTPGTITLPGTGVGALGSFAVDPELRTVRPGETAEFTVSINDPESGNAIYGLRMTGVPAAWASFPASVQANAQGQATFTLLLTPDANANLADYDFVIDGGNGFNAVGAAGGTLRVAGVPVNAADPDSRSVVARLTPDTATAGQGTTATFTVRVTNTGSATDTFDLTIAGLSASVTAAFEASSVTVPPGADNFREVRLTLTAAAGTPVGAAPFTVTATSATAAGSVAGTLTIVAAGVSVTLDRATANPGEALTATVTNTGTTTDTFDLAAAGPAGLVSTLGVASVTLGPGASRAIAVTTGAVAFAISGPIGLTVTATSRANTAVRDSATADLLVAPSTGLAARFDPPTQTLTAPGTVDLLLLVDNTGNTEDAYRATISGTTGALTVVLMGLDGLPAQEIPTFRLPGLSSGAILVRTTAPATGTVTVRITSLSDPARTASATATVTVVAPSPPTATPQAVITDSSAPVTVNLSGTDPNARPLTFTIIAGPSHGTLGPVTDGAVTYTPAPGYVGPDAFTFVANNGVATSAPAAVSVEVRAPRPVLLGFREFGAGAGAGHSAVARFFNPDGSERFSRSVFPGLTGGVRVTSADFNGDGIADLVAGTGPGSITRVVVLDGTTGAELFSIQPFEDRFTGGVFVAAGDITGDGVPDLVISPDESGGPRVRVFTGTGFGSVADFFGIDDENFRGGARAAVGDVNGDGFGDLVVSAGFGGGPRISVTDGRSLTLGSPTRLFNDFFLFEEALRNGAYVAAGDLDGDGFADVIGGGGPGGGPRVFALNGRELLTGPAAAAGVVANFFGGDLNNRGGIRVVARDLDGDRQADLVVGDGTGAGSRVTGYLGKDISRDGTPPERFALDAYPGFDGGVFVG